MQTLKLSNIGTAALNLAEQIRDQLPELLQNQVDLGNPVWNVVVLQAPDTNADNILIGGEASQDSFLIAENTYALGRVNLNTVYIRAENATDDVIVALLQDFS